MKSITTTPATDRELAALMRAAEYFHNDLDWPAIARRVRVKATRLAELRDAYPALWRAACGSAILQLCRRVAANRQTLALWSPHCPDAIPRQISRESIPSNLKDMQEMVEEFNAMAYDDPTITRLLGIFPLSEVTPSDE